MPTRSDHHRQSASAERRRVSWMAAGAVALALMATGCGGSKGPAALAARSEAGDGTITTAALSQVGRPVLVNGGGYPLYVFVPDHRRAVTCTEACAASWPPVVARSGHPPQVGGQVEAPLLGADKDPAGGKVVTYAGWPLYTYAADPQPGFAVGQGIDLNGGFWYLVEPDGTPLVPAGDPPAT